MFEMYKSNMYKHYFEDVEIIFDVRQSHTRKDEYIKFEYEYEKDRYRTLDSLRIKQWYPLWLRRFIFRSAEKRFCEIVSREVGRKLTYTSALKYKGGK